MSTRPLNVLCLDGGGVRGLSSLLILRSLMQQLTTSADLSTEPLPCEIFDMICGTSTGGIIALMLGRLRMNVDDAIACYLEFSRTVFERRCFVPPPPPSLLGFWSRLFGRTSLKPDHHTSSAIYDASKLEQWTKDIVAKCEEVEDASLRDPFDGTDNFCRTFVVATTKAYADSPPKIFRTYSSEERLADPCKIWEAARATTAAAPFFDPATFGSPPETYIDGSFSGSNNPSHLAIDEVSHVFPSREVGCLLSLGTGVPDVVSTGDDLNEIAQACMELVRGCEGVHNTVWKDFARRRKVDANDDGVYFRFSVDRGLGKVELDEWNREEELAGITGGYMRCGEEQEKAESCVKTLTARALEVAAMKRQDADLL